MQVCPWATPCTSVENRAADIAHWEFLGNLPAGSAVFAEGDSRSIQDTTVGAGPRAKSRVLTLALRFVGLQSREGLNSRLLGDSFVFSDACLLGEPFAFSDACPFGYPRLLRLSLKLLTSLEARLLLSVDAFAFFWR